MKLINKLVLILLFGLISLLSISCSSEAEPEGVSIEDLIFGEYEIIPKTSAPEDNEILMLTESGEFIIQDRCEGRFEVILEEPFDLDTLIGQIPDLENDGKNDGYSYLGRIEILGRDCLFFDMFPFYDIVVDWNSSVVMLHPEILFDYLYLGSIEKNIQGYESP